MDRSRVIILGLAALAAIAAAFLVRGLLGGGTEKSTAAIAPQPIAGVKVLVAATNIDAGRKLTAGNRCAGRCGPNPPSTRRSSRRARRPTSQESSRAPLRARRCVAGEPLSTTKIVHADIRRLHGSAAFARHARGVDRHRREVRRRRLHSAQRSRRCVADASAAGQPASFRHQHDHRRRARAGGRPDLPSAEQTKRSWSARPRRSNSRPDRRRSSRAPRRRARSRCRLRPLGDNGADRTLASAGGSGVSVIRYGVSRAGREPGRGVSADAQGHVCNRAGSDHRVGGREQRRGAPGKFRSARDHGLDP